ncbi:hypothetical protein F5Y08DRAFT_208730 [Xylaria arbuscula]|nr:hypothetical protein F5Y08DRAFT_208730 [Xylaria arbuscula]
MASTAAIPPYQIHTNRSQSSVGASTLPSYTKHAGANPAYDDDDDDIELASLSSSTLASSRAPGAPAIAGGPSSHSTTNSTFTPTKHLQIQTQGKNLLSFPTPTRPDPIPIFTLTPTGHLDRPLYLSVRPHYRSGSSFLAYGDDDTQTPLTTTTYRFGYGPGRRPIVVLGDPARNPPLSHSHSHSHSHSLADDEDENQHQHQHQHPHEGTARQIRSGEEEASAEAEEQGTQGFEITKKSLFTRAIRFAVPGLGTFGWRYGSAEERASFAADSLLICEVFSLLSSPSPQQSLSGSSNKGSSSSIKKEKEKGGEGKNGIRIAQLVRNETYRSPGSTRSSAGNGGRLMLNLSPFEEKRRERVEWLVVTTLISVLKREVDRRRAQQIATIGAIVS